MLFGDCLLCCWLVCSGRGMDDGASAEPVPVHLVPACSDAATNHQLLAAAVTEVLCPPSTHALLAVPQLVSLIVEYAAFRGDVSTIAGGYGTFKILWSLLPVRDTETGAVESFMISEYSENRRIRCVRFSDAQISDVLSVPRSFGSDVRSIIADPKSLPSTQHRMYYFCTDYQIWHWDGHSPPRVLAGSHVENSAECNDGRMDRVTFSTVRDLLIDSKGEVIYACDVRNRRIRRINLVTQMVTTACGHSPFRMCWDGASTDAVIHFATDETIKTLDTQTRTYLVISFVRVRGSVMLLAWWVVCCCV